MTRSHWFTLRLGLRPATTDLLFWQPEFALAEFGLAAENITEAKSMSEVCLGSEKMTLLDPNTKWQTEWLKGGLELANGAGGNQGLTFR